MIARLEKTRFLAVLGSSGTGKSSLVKCGLLAGLEALSARWRVVEFRPGGDALGNLAAALLKGDSEGAPDATPAPRDVEALKARFKREGPRELIKWCGEGHLANGTNLLLLIDQFEELFRYRNNDQRDEAQAFVSLVLESRWPRGVASPPQARVPIFAAITMRSDYLGACALLPGLAEAINEGTYLTPRLTREQCEEAIVGPALVCGLEIEDRLVTKLLNDMADFAPWEEQGEGKDQLSRLARQADQLPLMQYALNQMWRRANEARQGEANQQPGQRIRLRFDDYLGLERELDATGDKVYGELSESLRATAETVFRTVTSGTTVANATRRQTQFGQLVKICGEGTDGAVNTVVEAFGPERCQFLTSDVGPTGGQFASDAWIDIAHESLIRQWKMLSRWLESEGNDSHQWQRLKDDAERGALLYGRRLNDAIKLQDRVRPTRAWAERYGGGFDRVGRLIKISKLFRWIRGVGYGVIVAVTLGSGYLIYQAAQNADIAARNFEASVKSAQQLLDQLSKAVEHGDITVKGAKDMLRVANLMVEGVHTVKNTPETTALLIKLLNTASDIQGSLGNYQEAYANASKAKEMALPLNRIDPDNQLILEGLYHSTWRIGDAIIFIRADRRSALEESFKAYQEAEKLAQRWLGLSPKDAKRAREVMFVYQKIGDMQLLREGPDKAIDEYKTALSFIQKSLALDPENSEWRRDDAITMRRIGYALSAKGDQAGALEQLNAALKILEELSQKPDAKIAQSNFAANLLEIAAVYLRSDDAAGALKACRKAVEIQEKLIASDRDNATTQALLAYSYSREGAILRKLNDLENALAMYQQAYLYQEGLQVRDPLNAGRQIRLARAGIPIADLLVERQQNLERAVELYGKLIAVLEDAQPHEDRYDQEIFSAHMKIGDALVLANDGKGALTEYNLASAIARNLAAGHAEAWKKNLERSFLKIGDLLIGQGQKLEAVEHYQRAAKFVDGLAAKSPDVAGWSALARELQTRAENLVP
jgi:tetratricopeptide (TPR) repeat protein